MLSNGKKVSVVIPIYNEELTLKNLLDNLLECDKLDEIICINDGSTDRTEEILEGFGERIKKISYTLNKGKGYAMVIGTEAAKGDLIIFLDADFTNLTCKHVNMLLEPLEDESIKAVIATLIAKGPKLILNEICGQRVYHKKDLEGVFDEMKPSRWGVELLLNKALSHLKTERVHLEGDIGHLNKHEKHATLVSIQEYLLEGVEMAQQLLKIEPLSKEDTKILKALNEVKDFVDFDRRIKKLKDIKIQRVLEDYVKKYLNIDPKKLWPPN